MNKRELGKQYEQMAADYIYGLGFEILHQNWFAGHNELDIVAKKNMSLHFIEVKARETMPYDSFADAVNKKEATFHC
ncbi:MAG: YraN family protein [Bacteroidales bacterium]|nr:YraN family protein [Bacteroidales bacterium]